MESWVFFIYDHTILKKEEDDLKDAIIFFYPSKWLPDEQCALCGQLMGILNFFKNFQGCSPLSYTLQQRIFAVKHLGKYTLVLGGSRSVPKCILQQQLSHVYQLFQFYHGSIDQVRKTSNGNYERFLKLLSDIWDTYLPFCRHYEDQVAATFNSLPTVVLGRGHASLYLRASHLLQFSQKRPGVLSGCLFFQGKVLCSQLPTNLTWKLLMIRPQQKNFPCRMQSPGFTLPAGVRILTVSLTAEECSQLCPFKGRNLVQDEKKATQDLDRPPDLDLDDSGVTQGEDEALAAKKLMIDETPDVRDETLFALGNVIQLELNTKDSEKQGEESHEKGDSQKKFSRGSDDNEKGKVNLTDNSNNYNPEQKVPNLKCGEDIVDKLSNICRDSSSSGKKQDRILEEPCSLRTDSMEFDNGRCDSAFEDLETSISPAYSLQILKETATGLDIEQVENLSTTCGTEQENMLEREMSCPSNETGAIIPDNDTSLTSTPTDISSARQDIPHPSYQIQQINKSSQMLEVKCNHPIDMEKSTQQNSEKENVCLTQETEDRYILVVENKETTSLDYSNNSDQQKLCSDISSTDTHNVPLVEPISVDTIGTPYFTPTVSSENSPSLGVLDTGLHTEAHGTLPDSSTQLSSSSNSDFVCLPEGEEVTAHEKLTVEVNNATKSYASQISKESSMKNLEESVFEPDQISCTGAKMDSGISENNIRKGEVCLSSVANNETTGRNDSLQQILSFNLGMDKTTSVSDSFTTAMTSVHSTPRTPNSPQTPSKDERTAKLFRNIRQVAENSVLSVQSRSRSVSSSSSVSDMEGNLTGLPAGALYHSRVVPGCDSPSVQVSKQASGQVSLITRSNSVPGSRKKKKNTASTGELSTVSQLQASDKALLNRTPPSNSGMENTLAQQNKVHLPSNVTSSADIATPSTYPSGRAVKNETESSSSQTQEYEAQIEVRPSNLLRPNSLKIQRKVSFEDTISSPASQSELPINDVEQHQGKCDNPPELDSAAEKTVDLYIQGNSDLALVLLLERGAGASEKMVHALWKAALPQLAELDYLLKQSLGSPGISSRRDSSHGYSFLKYDSFDGTLKGNLQQPVTGVDHACVGTIMLLHNDFQCRPLLKEITIRNHAGSMYGHHSLNQETYFQPRISTRPSSGVPLQGDQMLCLDQKAQLRLYRDHGITVL